MSIRGYHPHPGGPTDTDWDDDALAGCRAWIAGWRQTHGEGVNPPKDRNLIAAIGRDAVQLMRDSVPRTELCRLMWAAGRDGKPLGAAA